MDVEHLHNMLRKVQEPKGYFFNRDGELVRDLLAGLMENKERYGYMSCPCRLSAGDYEKDRDIICPCLYRAPDVKEYGSCYCGLYVSKDWNDDAMSHECVPERRPAEKMMY